MPEGGFVKNQQGTIVVAKLNSHDLKRLAQAGQGVYQTITVNDADIQQLLVGINQPIQQQDKQNDNLLLEQWADKGVWLLLSALPLAALMFRKGLLCFALLVMLPLPKNSYALGWQDLWQTKDQQAQQAYKQQDFAKAAELFGQADWKAAARYKAGEYDKALESLKSSKSASSAYNQGNALAQAGQLEQAIKAYEQALVINPNDSDAKHNKDVVEKALEQKQQKDEQQQSKDDSQQNNEGEQGEKPEQQEQDKNEDKPEQKPEQKPSEQAPSEEKQPQDKTEEKQPEAEQQPAQAEQPNNADKEPVPEPVEPSTEQQQANEQWLKRIPDDPAGLLKRKFKYQYGQRGRQTEGNPEAW